jgi:hypothetical protein
MWERKVGGEVLMRAVSAAWQRFVVRGGLSMGGDVGWRESGLSVAVWL